MTRTTAGVLQGCNEAGVWVFRGVPYAQVTGPHGRWRAAQPPMAWTGTRLASSWGPIAPQTPPVPGFSFSHDPTASDEDCLNLNVWTPALDDGRRPVMVWLHGGGFTTGTGSSALFGGGRLASKGVVVVTINYRLGALGLLTHPDLASSDDPGGGNWSLRDQIAALGWVRDNIAGFGGDPDNVTLFGESAGAMSISDLLGAGDASGLFHRAVIQSGPPATASPQWAKRRAERLAGHLGVAVDAMATLREIPSGRLVEATQRLAAEAPSDGGLPLPLLPVVDGVLLDDAPGDLIVEGAASPVPILLGTTRDECALFTTADHGAPGLDDAAVAQRLAHLVGPAGRDIVDAYHGARRARGEGVSGRDLWTAVTTDYVFRLPLQALAAAHAKYQSQTYSYLFAWESPFLNGMFGSCHGLEIPFVFGTVEDTVVQPFTGAGPQASLLSERMQHAWIAFARHGDPSCDAVGSWPAFDPMSRPTMVLGPDVGVEDDPRAPERLIWEETGTGPGPGHHHD
ncbi:MAG: carboxylesterase family protein [Acidimicrobiales bacterium]